MYQNTKLSLIDVAEAIGPSCQKKIVGIRPGEKLHEEMITASDSHFTLDLGEHYAILPSDGKLYQTYLQSSLSSHPLPKASPMIRLQIKF